MLTKVQKWGNSRAIRIPKELALESGLDFNQKVELEFVEGQLRIIPVDRPRYTLEELVAGITPENRHEEWDTGPPVGREAWWWPTCQTAVTRSGSISIRSHIQLLLDIYSRPALCCIYIVETEGELA